MAAEMKKISMGVGGWNFGGYVPPVELRFREGRKGGAVSFVQGKVVLPIRGFVVRPGETWTGELIARERYYLFKPQVRSDGHRAVRAEQPRPTVKPQATQAKPSPRVEFTLVKSNGRPALAFIKTSFGVARITGPSRDVSFAKMAEYIERLGRQHGPGVFQGARTVHQKVKARGYTAKATYTEPGLFVGGLEEAQGVFDGFEDVALAGRPLAELFKGRPAATVEKEEVLPRKTPLPEMLARSMVGYSSLAPSTASNGYTDYQDTRSEPVVFANARRAWLRLDHPDVVERMEKGRQFCSDKALRKARSEGNQFYPWRM